MKWVAFHHPDISLPVIRRKASRELITLLAGASELLVSGGRSVLYSGCYPNRQAFQASVSRLRKQGLITISKTDESLPELKLTPSAISTLPPYYTPEKFWNKRWNKWWYILMFDVPEKNRSYRDTLRKFLKKMRSGCLQKSVWITPVDIRPDYEDLNQVANVDNVAFLFESRTVLGFGDQSVVQEAWDFTKLYRIHELYLQFSEENLSKLKSGNPSNEEILQLLRINNQAYAQAMFTDPLLPKELHPDEYLGTLVFHAHSELCRQAGKQLR